VTQPTASPSAAVAGPAVSPSAAVAGPAVSPSAAVAGPAVSPSAAFAGPAVSPSAAVAGPAVSPSAAVAGPESSPGSLLAAIIDAQTEVLDALVGATQAQIRVLIGLRVHRDGGQALIAAQSEVQVLTRRLESLTAEVRPRALMLAQRLGLPAGPPSLQALAFALPLPERQAGLDAVSALRSLGQALAELQIIAQAHAQRGLHAVVAWRTVLGVPDTDIGATYTRRGRARARQTSPLPALSLDLDL